MIMTHRVLTISAHSLRCLSAETHTKQGIYQWAVRRLPLHFPRNDGTSSALGTTLQDVTPIDHGTGCAENV